MRPESATWDLPKDLYYIAMNYCNIFYSIIKSIQEQIHLKEDRNKSSLKTRNKIQSGSTTL